MARIKGSQKTGGRSKGTPNKENKALREMILEALDQVGGVKYLAEQAQKNPGPFMALIGKVLPKQITGEGGGPVSGKWTVEFVKGKDAPKDTNT